MPFLIETFDKPDHGDVRIRERDAHLAFLAQHKALLLASGAKLNDDGSNAGGGIYIVNLETREETEQFIAQDPYMHADLFAEVKIVRWRKAYVDGVCYL